MHPAERVERDAWAALADVPGISVLEVADAVCISMPALRDSPMVNRTIGVADGEMLDVIAEFYADVRYYVALTPDVHPDMRPQLEQRGFTRGYDWMKFTRGATDVPPARTQLDVRRTGAGFAEVVASGFELPATVVPTLASIPSIDGYETYVAYEDGEPAAAGAIFVSGDIAWLGFAATKPEHRRKGGQGAILNARLVQARDLGVATVVTETGVMQEGRASNSYRNILRSGFEEAYVRENYLSPARAIAAS